MPYEKASDGNFCLWNGRGSQAKKCGKLLGVRTDKEMDSSLEPIEGTQSLISIQWDLFQSSYPQKVKAMCLYCLKPSHLCKFLHQK